LQLDPDTIPNFSQPYIQVSHDLRVHITLEAGGKKIKEHFLFKNVQVMSNKTANSPLNRAYLCTFVPEIRRSTLEASPLVYAGREKEAEAEISNAYLALSRLLTENAIPNNPISIEPGKPTIFLHSVLGPIVSHKPAITSNTPPSTAHIEDPADADQELLDTILDGHAGFRATSIPKEEEFNTGIASGKKVVMWHNQNPLKVCAVEADCDNDVYIRLEMIGTFALRSLIHTYGLMFTLHRGSSITGLSDT
jgi:hypothetical protein